MYETWFGILLVLLWSGTLVRLRPWSLRRQPRSARTTASPNNSTNSTSPLVSVVIAARNEVGHIERTLRSLQKQTYPNLQVTVVNDRSTDETAAVIAGVKVDWPQLQVIQVDTLPSSWLGKNHALYVGAQASQGEWLLFTDADIYFYPDAIDRAVSHAIWTGADHVTVPPTMLQTSYWLSSLISLFSYNLMIVFRPHFAHRPRAKAFVGIGAFNLLTQKAYQGIGTHAAFRMRPDDDLMLGKKVKQAGYRQDFVAFDKFIEVQWYPSVAAMVRGLEKNALTPFDFSFTRLLVAVIGAFFYYEGPFLGLLLAPGLTRLWYVMAIILMCAGYVSLRGYMPAGLRWFLSFPVVVPLFLYVMLRAGLLFLWRGGIYWRGTFYKKHELLQMRHPDH